MSEKITKINEGMTLHLEEGSFRVFRKQCDFIDGEKEMILVLIDIDTYGKMQLTENEDRNSDRLSNKMRKLESEIMETHKNKMKKDLDRNTDNWENE